MHQIEHHTYSGEYTPKKILGIIGEFAYDPQESSHYHGNMTFHENVICEDYDAAIERIEQYDKGWYSDHAVKYKDYPTPKDTKAIQDIRNRIREMREAKTNYYKSNSIENFKSELVSCKKCNSKVNKTYVKYYRCPVCGNTMMSDTVKNKLEWYDNKISELDSKLTASIKSEQRKLKPTIKWLVKVEWHC